MPASIRVIVINYNAGDAVLRCVASVLASAESLHLVIADNASSDGSCEKLRSRYGANPRLELVENATNLGFGRAVNALALRAGEPMLLILNPDCELAPGALSALRGALDTDARAALAAACVVDARGEVQRGTYRHFPDPRKALMTASGLASLGPWIPLFQGVERSAPAPGDSAVLAEAVSGACFLVRTDVFRKLGGFDESFEFHFEDLDLMLRLKESGHHCLYVGAARVVHEPGTSSRSRPWWVHRQKHLGLLRFFDKHPQLSGGGGHGKLVRFLVWAHYVLTLPLVPLRR